MKPPRMKTYENHVPMFNEDGKPLCRQCGDVCTGRRTSYCSQDCKDKFLVPRLWSYARKRVAERDKWVCAECGRDTYAIYKQFVELFRLSLDGETRERSKQEEKELIQKLKQEGFTMRHRCGLPYMGDLWQTDHINPVVEGGGSCELDNLRTLCTPCHKRVTKQLRGTLKQKRRQQTQLEYEEWLAGR